MVSVLAFNSDNPSSNPAEAYSFSVKIVFEKKRIKQKEAGDMSHFFKKGTYNHLNYTTSKGFDPRNRKKILCLTF